ncbi:Hypothetical predicted protein [Paramuricea clavata]|uniref:Uncharacterized protein n=1 Tax=Paramuricea clavata TaxID=317549 RepID=A0A6S7JHY6_PARCT|nr:Hypothetical predicted protein [Paramuricea clavata]
MVVNSESGSSDFFRSSNETQSTFNGEKYLHITKKGSIKWEGSFESLQGFFNSFLKAETKWMTPRGGCKQYEADNNLVIRWYSSSKLLCFSGPTSEKLIDLVPKQQQIIDGVEGEILVDQTLDYDDETTNTTDDEHSGADNDKHLNVENVEHSSVSLEKIAENFKLLENRVNAKVLELSSKIDKLKSNSVCNNDLSQRCENLVYAMASLKAKVSDLEEEKKSLLMVIKVRRPKSARNKSDTVIRNQFEILSDSDIEIKSQEIPLVKGRQKVINKSQGQTNKNNDELQNKESASPSKAKVPSTVIIGDSMTKHLDSRRLQQSSKTVRRVSTQTFRGATTYIPKIELRDILQHTINDNNPADVLWEDFKTRFLFVADIHAPQITRKVKSEYTPWMTNNIKKQIYHRDFLKKKAINTGSENTFVAYKRARNALNKLIKDTKGNYFDLILQIVLNYSNV